jgi:hypothetical protein
MTTQLESAATIALSQKDPKSLDIFVKSEELIWKKHAKPVGPSSRFVEELGSVESILKELFSLKNPGDVLSKPYDFSGKKQLVRLVKRDVKAETAEETKQKSYLAKAESYRSIQTFVAKSQKKLVELYRSQKEIKENPMLFARAE